MMSNNSFDSWFDSSGKEDFRSGAEAAWDASYKVAMQQL
jgi:hypothetical protein